MKVGDLVKNRTGHTGIVTGMGYDGTYLKHDECVWKNPDVHVLTVNGRRLWVYRQLEVISESR